MISLITSIAFGVLVALVGWMSLQQVLDQNSCLMTVSVVDKKAIKVESTISDMKLYRFYSEKKTSVRSSKSLNPQPVLFVPGHGGDAAQARSLNSFMHNNISKFQYFAIENSNPNLFAALHASSIITQAVFLNDAIRTIRNLYRKRQIHAKKRHSEISSTYEDRTPNNQRELLQIEASKDVKVIIVGHCVGGVVARTAALLSNHPKCAVNAILLLSSPTQMPPYNVDASNEELYRSVNDAWRQSLYRTSRDCVRTNALDGVVPENSSLITGGPVAAEWRCPPCTAEIKILSISGGAVDGTVQPALTSLEALGPRPANSTRMHKRNAPGPSLTRRLTQGVSSLSRFAISFFKGSKSHPPSLNDTIPAEPANTTRTGESADAIDNKQNSNTRNSKLPFNSFYSISLPQWKKDVGHYIEPQHLYIRTSQIFGVGFPVDHQAMLWCHQLLQTITHALFHLSATSSYAPLDWTEAVTLKHQYQSNYTEDDLQGIIPPIQAIIKRNESSFAFYDSANSDWEYVLNILSPTTHSLSFASKKIGLLRALCMNFVTSQLQSVLLFYFLTSILILLVPLVLGLTDSNRDNIAQNTFALVNPSVHLWGQFLSTQLNLHIYTNSIGLGLTVFTIIVAILALVLSRSPYVVLRRYSSFLNIPTAYGLALAIRILLMAILGLLSRALAGAAIIFRFIARKTIWSKAIRKQVRNSILKPFKKGLQTYLALVPDYASAPFVCLVVVIGASAPTLARLLSGGSTAVGSYCLSVLSVSLTLHFIWEYTQHLMMTATALSTHPLHSDMTLLLAHAPALAMCIPTFQYSCSLLFGSYQSFPIVLPVLALFEPERIHFCIFSFILAWHLQLANRERQTGVVKITPALWLSEMAGSFGVGGFATGRGSSLKVSGNPSETCVHEDGGRHAIFERTTSYVDDCSDGVLGCTYKVVACACPSDPTLKSFSEWCEFCACRKCGPSVTSRSRWSNDQLNDNSDGNSSNSEQFNIGDLNPDLLLVIGLVAIGLYGAVFLSPSNSYLFASALIGLCYLLRSKIVPFLVKLS